MKDTLVVNFIASPGCGKSTMSANLFSMLKWNKIDCELVSEFAKELVWEERHETFKDELYLFAKQNHRLFRVNGKVDVVITDRPIILSVHYNNEYGDRSLAFENMVLETHKKYKSLNFFINRKKDYNPNGRNQTEEESNEASIKIKKMLNRLNIEYIEIDGNELGVENVFNHVINHLTMAYDR